jgi:hypothetical protein
MRLVLFAHAIVALLNTINAERYYIYSEASDSFLVNIRSDDSNCKVVPLFVTPEIDPLKICGRIEQPFGPFSNRREKITM